MPTIHPASQPAPPGVASPFVRLKIACQPADERTDALTEAWVCHLEGGLCLQYYEDRILAQSEAYGITQQEGYRLTGPWFHYEAARALQQCLLSLDVDWTQNWTALNAHTPALLAARHWIGYWCQTQAVFLEEAKAR